MEFSRQEYWSELPFPSRGDLPKLGTEPRSPALKADSTVCATREAPYFYSRHYIFHIFIPGGREKSFNFVLGFLSLGHSFYATYSDSYVPGPGKAQVAQAEGGGAAGPGRARLVSCDVYSCHSDCRGLSPTPRSRPRPRPQASAAGESCCSPPGSALSSCNRVFHGSFKAGVTHLHAYPLLTCIRVFCLLSLCITPSATVPAPQ